MININHPVCCIVGAGPCGEIEFQPKEDDYVIAADGGLRHLEKAGLKADLVVGDFDTLGYEPEHENVVRLQVEKDWTDTFVAMEKGVELGYRNFLFYGCLGGKLEHTIANLQHLVWLAQRGLNGWMTGEGRMATALCGTGAKSVRLAWPGKQEGGPAAGTLISVFSMTEQSEGVTIKGLKYQIEGGKLTNSFPLGVSNEFTGETAEISVKKGILLVITEN